jgi:hypothetical protein
MFATLSFILVPNYWVSDGRQVAIKCQTAADHGPSALTTRDDRQVLGVALSAALMQAILQRRLSADITGPGSQEVRHGTLLVISNMALTLHFCLDDELRSSNVSAIRPRP